MTSNVGWETVPTMSRNGLPSTYRISAANSLAMWRPRCSQFSVIGDHSCLGKRKAVRCRVSAGQAPHAFGSPLRRQRDEGQASQAWTARYRRQSETGTDPGPRLVSDSGRDRSAPRCSLLHSCRSACTKHLKPSTNGWNSPVVSIETSHSFPGGLLNAPAGGIPFSPVNFDRVVGSRSEF